VIPPAKLQANIATKELIKRRQDIELLEARSEALFRAEHNTCDSKVS